MRRISSGIFLALAAGVLLIITPAPLPAQTYSPFTLEKLLPDDIAQNTDINAWGWFSVLHDSDRNYHYYYESDVAVGVTQRLSDQLAATADIHFLNDNYDTRGFLEQAFITAEPLKQTGTLITFGKFNADFGVESRNEWDRLAGTTSLLFGAQPQDLVGLEITQPLLDDTLSLRPFVATRFDGHQEYNNNPIAGLSARYAPNDSLTVKFTNFFGPGEMPKFDDYYFEYFSYYIFDNWTGPWLHAREGGSLYFSDLNLTWNPTRDITLAAEGLLATNGTSADHLAWSGLLFLANYDVTDRFRVFTRWSWLDDAQWIVGGATETRQEASGGLAYKLMDGLEIRGEYRHDFSPKQDLDTFSTHLTFSY